MVLASSQIVWIADGAGQLIVEDSSTWLVFTGQTAAQAQGNGWLDAVHPDDRVRTAQVWAEGVAKKTFCQAEYRLRTAAGEYRHTVARGVPILAADGRVQEWVGTNTDITEQKLAEEGLRRTVAEMRRLALIVQCTDNAVILTNPQGLIEWVNDGFTRICEYRLDEVAGKSPGSILQGPDTDQATVKHMHERLLQGNGFKVEIVNYTKSGRPYWLASEVQPSLDDQGSLTGFMAIESDITARKRTDEMLNEANKELEVRVAQRTTELSEANEFLKAVLENIQDGIVACNAEGVITLLNRTVRELHKLPDLPTGPSEWSHFYSLYRADGQTPMTVDEIPLTRAACVARKSRTWKWLLSRKTGAAHTILANGRAVYDEHGKKLGAVVSLNDITERKRADDVLRESEERFRLLVDGVQDYAIIMLDPGGKIISWNSGAERINGYKTEEIVGRSFSCFYSSEDMQGGRPEYDLKIAVEHGRFKEDGWRVRKNGTGFWASVVITVVRDKDGHVRGFSKITRDITERKRAEMELQKAHDELERRVETRTAELALAKNAAESANRAKSEFFSRMSHELRTPLNVILGFGQLLEMDVLSGPQRESAEQIGKGGRHLLTLINEVLDITRVESGGKGMMSPERVDIDEVVHDVLGMVQPLADAAGVRILPFHTGTTCAGSVRADLQRLKQILLNLLANGIKYNRKGGTLALSCTEAPDAMTRISVTDTGPGIAPEKMHRLFVPFDRLDADKKGIEGTGLGLTLVKGLVEAMQGKIGAESTPGQGSTFWVELARIDTTSEPAEENLATAIDPGETPSTLGTVLCIEDNPANFRLIERILKLRPGVRLLSATHGRLGIDLARDHRPDLIFLDLHLPDIQGDEVLRQLQDDAATRNIPVIMLSADATPHQIERLRAAGATRYMVKPLDVKEFLQILDETLKKRGH